MRRRHHLLWFCLTLSAFRAASASPLAIIHVTVVDVRSGLARPEMTVLIEGDRITAVRPSKPKESLEGEGIPVVDGSGAFLIPGLWDMHVHTDGAERILHSLLANGITGVRDMAGDAAKLAEAKRRQRAGELTGPRLVFAGPMLEGPPAHQDEDTWIIRSPDEARDAVERLADLHVDFIKVHDGLSRDAFLAIAAACKRKGLSFAGHVPASVTPAEASDLGQKSIEHFEFVPKPCLVLFEPRTGATARQAPRGCHQPSFDALLHRFAANGTWLDPTIQSFRFFAPKQWPAILAEFRELVPLIRRNHVSILAGTDSSSSLEEQGDPPGVALHDELALLVDSGFTPVEALRAATWNPAAFLGLADSLGTIEPGKTADLVLLANNPLQDIRNTKRILAVITSGRYLDRNTLDTMLGTNCRSCAENPVHEPPCDGPADNRPTTAGSRTIHEKTALAKLGTGTEPGPWAFSVKANRTSLPRHLSVGPDISPTH